jgi:hypothetical protein
MFVVEILGDSVTMNDSTYYINFSPFAIFCIGAASSILVVAITIYYFIPVKTWMPLLANSGRLVFESCEQLSYVDLPEDGLVAWGDVSAEDRNLAGFGKEVRNVKTGVYYPSPRLEGSIRESYSDSHPLLRE